MAVLAIAFGIATPAVGQRVLPGARAAERQSAGAPEAERLQPPNRGAVLARAIRSLNISRAQQRAIREVRDRHDARMREIGRRYLDGRRQIDDLLFAETPDVDHARALARDLSKLAGERATTRTLIELEVFQVLTPEQRGEMRKKLDTSAPVEPPDAARRRHAQPPAQTKPEAVEPEAGDIPDDALNEPLPEASAPAARRPKAGGMGAGGLLARMALSRDQRIRLRQVRRQHGPVMRDLTFRFRQAQHAIDEAMIVEKLDPERVRHLADDLGRAEADRELERFETEAAIRQILTPEQATLLRQSREAGQP
jgi:Spy/CpxP family protein refolding chaperone